jgi:hypothetical protein
MKINGMSITISTSKIKNIIATIKNRRENGERDFFMGSNPHSKGVSFSRLVIVTAPMIAGTKIINSKESEIDKINRKTIVIIYEPHT